MTKSDLDLLLSLIIAASLVMAVYYLFASWIDRKKWRMSIQSSYRQGVADTDAKYEALRDFDRQTGEERQKEFQQLKQELENAHARREKLECEMAELKAKAARCSTCGWPLVQDQKGGCVEGNCSMRPLPK